MNYNPFTILEQFKNLKNVPYYVLVALTGTGLFLLLKRDFLGVDLTEWKQRFGIWILIPTILFLLLLITKIFNTLVVKFFLYRKKRSREKEILRNLDSLSEGERSILRYYVKNNCRTTNGTINPIAESLVNKGLLSMPSQPANLLDIPFTIPENVWILIRNRKDFIE